MTRLEFFESGLAQQAMDMKIVSEGMFAKFVRYKAYMILRSNGVPVTQAMEEASEQVGCSYSRMYWAVKFFDGFAKSKQNADS